MARTAEHPDVAALMGRYCDGDPVAFQRLYALLAPRILSYLTGLTGDCATAEALLQRTFLKVHQGRGAYVRDADPVPWIYAIAHRTCLDAPGTKRRRAHRAYLALMQRLGGRVRREDAP